jgi:PKD repeat protein
VYIHLSHIKNISYIIYGCILMEKMWGWGLFFVIMAIVPVSIIADQSLSISPEILYQDMPLVIQYSGFTNGDEITADFEVSYVSDDTRPAGITEGFLMHPFRLENEQIIAMAGNLMINENPVPDGIFSESTEGMFSLQLTKAVASSGEQGNVSFRISGLKSSGPDNGSINFIPVFSANQGMVHVTITIGNTTADWQIPYNVAIPAPDDPDLKSSVRTSESDIIIPYPIMRLTPEQLRSEMRDNIMIDKIPDAPGAIDGGAKNLLSYVPYIPAERDQGNCGNCWVWASTGAIEVAHSVQNGVHDRISIQYLNSNYNNGTGPNWACMGGSSTTFVSFYNATPFRQVIPWSNSNASYVDANACPGGDCSGGTNMAAANITGFPNYPVSSISNAIVSTYSGDQSQAIANIRSQLDANKALYYGFRLPNNSAWMDFSIFWRDQPESSLWDPDLYTKAGADGGGHGVLLVGYNQTSLNHDEWYWEALNSWGNSTSRPNGLFRIKMDMDYSAMGIYYNNYFYAINVTYPSESTPIINATAGTGGIIDPFGLVSVPFGSSQAFSITPNSSYLIADVLVDGSSMGAVSTHSFTNVTSNHTIHATFNQSLPVAMFTSNLTNGPVPLTVQFTDQSTGNPHSWNWDFGEGNISSVQHPVHTYLMNGLYTVNLTVSNSAGSNSSQVANYINASDMVTHTINATAGTGGSIIPSGLIQVQHGGSQTFTINPDSLFEVSAVVVDGENKGAIRSYSFSDIISDHQISAEFSRVGGEYAINATSDPYTVIYPNGIGIYPEGSNQTYLTQSKPGSDLLNITVEDISYPANPTWTFTDIARDYNISTTGQYTPGQIHVMFTMNETTGSAPMVVQFIDQSIGDPTTWYWQFGDGTNSTVQNPVHLYNIPGVYSVTLRSTNNQTGGVGTWNNAISVIG